VSVVQKLVNVAERKNPIFLGPLYSRYMIDKFVPQFSILVSLAILITGVSIGTDRRKVSVVQKLVNVAERKNPIRVAWTRTGEVQ
jgi:hypothetical protein